MILRHRDLCELILYELYWMAADPNGPEDVAPFDLYPVFEDRTSTKFYEAAIEKLGFDELIEKVGVLPDTITIASKGITYVDAALDNPNSYLWNEHHARPPEQRQGIPAADRFVELDHNSQSYIDAIRLGQELIEAVRASNTYAENDNKDKEQRVAELEAGYRLLRAPRINRTAVKIILGSAMIYLAAKFSDQIIGELAKEAWSAVKKLIGLE